MKRSSVLASLAAVLTLACASLGVGCLAQMDPAGGDPSMNGPQAPAAKQIFYATPEVAARIAPDRIVYRASSASAPSAAQRPYVMGESGLVPASSEDLESAASDGDDTHPESSSSSGNSNPGPPHCSLCEYDTWCGPICCPGQPHCQPYEV